MKWFKNEKKGTYVIEDGQIIFKNFAGVARKYNAAGSRNFNVFIDDPELVKLLVDEGFNVRILKPRDEDDEPRHVLKINVSYKKIPPIIVQHTGRNSVNLDEEDIAGLDNTFISSVDVEFSPYRFQREEDGSEGRSAYLRTLHVILEEDVFADKYAEEEYPGE